MLNYRFIVYDNYCAIRWCQTTCNDMGYLKFEYSTKIPRRAVFTFHLKFRVSINFQELAHKAIDYLIKFVDSSDPYVPQLVMGSLYSMARAHAVYMRKHKAKLEQLEKETLIPSGKEMAHYILMMIEGKRWVWFLVYSNRKKNKQYEQCVYKS